jgi:CRP-like cAMP-binding protein
MEIYRKNNCLPDKEVEYCLNKLKPSEKEDLNSKTLEINYRKGEMIIKQGTFASKVIYLVNGLAKVDIERDNNKLITTLVPPNKFIGIQSLYAEKYYHYSVTAIVECKAKIIDIGFFGDLVKKNGEFAAEVIKFQNHLDSFKDNRMFSLTQKHLHARLADILLCLSNRIFSSQQFELPLSRKDLASLTGMANESLIRIMKEFKDRNIIDTVGKYIAIKDENKLLEISRT